MSRCGIHFRAALVYILMQFALGINAATAVALLRACNVSALDIPLIFLGSVIARILFNVPTGIFADVFGRRNSTAVGLVIFGSSYMILVLANSFWHFFLANFIGGIGFTFIVGAYDALVLEKMSSFTDNADKRVFAHITRYSQIGRMFGTFLGGYLGYIYARLPWLTTSLILYFLFVWLTFFIENDHKVKDVENRFTETLEMFKNRISLLKQYYKAHRQTVLVNFSGILNGLSFYMIFLTYQPYFMKASGKPIWILSYIGILYSLSMVLGTFILDKFAHVKSMSVFFMIAAALVLGLIPSVGFYPGVFFYFVFAFSYSIYNSSRLGLLTSYTTGDSEQRATLFSLDNMLSDVFIALMYLMVPKISFLHNENAMWHSAALLLIPSAIIYSMAESKFR